MPSQTKAGTPAEQAPLVFSGHVETLKAASLPGIAAADTAIVVVDHVVTAPAMFAALAGAHITVRFGTLPMPPVGSPRTF